MTTNKRKKTAPTKKKAAAKAKKPQGKALNIDEIITMIIDGKTYREMSKYFSVPLATLHDYANKTEHSARVREALDYSASTYADKAEEVLVMAPGVKEELMRARELAQHYRWKAGKRSPKKYGDKVDMTSDGKAVAFKIGYKKPGDGANDDNADDTSGD